MARACAKSGEAELLARGNLTLPRALRNAHDLKPGTRFTIIDLGGGSRMLVPRRLRVDALAEPPPVSSFRGSFALVILSYGRPSGERAGRNGVCAEAHTISAGILRLRSGCFRKQIAARFLSSAAHRADASRCITAARRTAVTLRESKGNR